MTPVTSWGHLHAMPHHAVTLFDPASAQSQVSQQAWPALAYGMGRSYGDVCLNPHGTLWMTTGLDRFAALDRTSGRLRCEAGVLLGEIQRVAIPQGWMLPVTPGTQWVTVGGAIANDVHGKNHHAMGSFGDHVRSLTLLRTDGSVLECTPQQHGDWLRATIGGMGLTGVVVLAELQLRPVNGPWLQTETIAYDSLDAFFDLADSSEQGWEYTVSWIDCLSDRGRGIFMRANHASTGPTRMSRQRPHTMPVTPPVSLVNRLTLRPFNTAYYHLQRCKAGTAISHYEPFFYPLDSLLEWHRMYGPHGFYQYQSVVPRTDGKAAIHAMLQTITASGEGSFLAVLKTFGERHPLGMMSFPMPGVTLALDFPNKGDKTLKLMEQLDAIVRHHGGRLYPAKDARMPRDLFEQGYPRLHHFLPYRDPNISSAMSRRLIGS